MVAPDPFQNIVVGYPKLAAKMEIQPEVAIFRRFGALNAQNLLYLQAELTYLERELRKQQVQDANDNVGDGSSYAINWFWLRESAGTADSQQLDLVLQIRETLKEYSKLNSS